VLFASPLYEKEPVMFEGLKIATGFALKVVWGIIVIGVIAKVADTIDKTDRLIEAHPELEDRGA
jgi:hypothetical protein